MVLVEHGIVSKGGIAFDRPLSLPDGAKVTVRVEVTSDTPVVDEAVQPADPTSRSLPFIGQWADRDDLGESSDYVRQERAKWQQRAYRQD